MKKFAFALALVFVALVGPSSAHWGIGVSRYTSPAAGLNSYTLSIEVSPGYVGPQVFQDIFINDVHQTNYDDGRDFAPSVYTDDFWDEWELREYGKYDTHFLFESRDVIGTQKEIETNDGLNPAGLPFY